MSSPLHNPRSTDKTATIVSFGEVLWDLLPTGPLLGGAPFNFAFRASTLGHRAVIDGPAKPAIVNEPKEKVRRRA